MLSYAEAENMLLNILNDYVNGIEEKKRILKLIELGSWRSAIYEIDKQKFKSFTTNDHKNLKDIFGIYC